MKRNQIWINLVIIVLLFSGLAVKSAGTTSVNGLVC